MPTILRGSATPHPKSLLVLQSMREALLDNGATFTNANGAGGSGPVHLSPPMRVTGFGGEPQLCVMPYAGSLVGPIANLEVRPRFTPRRLCTHRCTKLIPSNHTVPSRLLKVNVNSYHPEGSGNALPSAVTNAENSGIENRSLIPPRRGLHEFGPTAERSR